MPTQRACLHHCILSLAFFLVSPILATIANNWTNPNARLPDFSSTYLVGERVYLSWQPLNNSLSDLWLRRYSTSTDEFALRIASSLDIGVAGSFAWTIAVSEEEVLIDTRFTFVFVIQGSSYGTDTASDFESPGFNLMIVNQATPPNGTVSSTGAAASTVRPTTFSATPTISPAGASLTSPPPSSGSSALDSSQIVGIAVGTLAFMGLAGFCAGYYVFKRRLTKHMQRLKTQLKEPMKGPYEVLGNNSPSVEVSGKETQVHEMNASQTLAHESDSAPIHEISNTVKRPGVHEMPG